MGAFAASLNLPSCGIGQDGMLSYYVCIPKRAEVRPSFGGMDMIVANVSVLEELRALKRELQDSL